MMKNEAFFLLSWARSEIDLLLFQEEPLSVCRAVMVRNETLKLVLRGDRLDKDHHSELYDLVRDPLETENLYRFVTSYQWLSEQKRRRIG